jgi:hypothetical protein
VSNLMVDLIPERLDSVCTPPNKSPIEWYSAQRSDFQVPKEHGDQSSLEFPQLQLQLQFN